MMTYCDLTLDGWLDFLENRHQDAIHLRLWNAKAVAERLDLLDLKTVVITVAGTNGKGSTVAALTAIYCAAGYRVGTYTSPHLLVFNERICVNQQPIDDAVLCAAFTTIETAREDIALTYFEMATLAALLHFKQSKLDVVILEVGVGGRLDATNIIDADLAIITTIDLDHQAYLGDNKEAIGYEKAGILRANTPFIYADQAPPLSIIEHAKRLNAPMQCLGLNYSYTSSQDSVQIARETGEFIQLPRPRLHLNAAVAAVIASDCLSALLPVTHEHWVLAMQTVKIQGRQQRVEGPVTTVFDVAHNPQAVLLLADFIKQCKPVGDVHAVFSGLNDKDLCGLIRPMHACVNYWYPARLSGKRASSESLLNAAFQAETNAVYPCFSDPVAAYCNAMQRAKEGDLIVVYGSFLTVSDVMGYNEEIQ